MDSRANLPTNIRFKSTNSAKIFILPNEFRTFSYQTFLPGFTNVQRFDKFSYLSVKHTFISCAFLFLFFLFNYIQSNYRIQLHMKRIYRDKFLSCLRDVKCNAG